MNTGNTPNRGSLVAAAALFGVLAVVFLASGLVLVVNGPGRTRWGGAALLTLAVLVGWLAELAVEALRRGRAGPRSGRVLGAALGGLVALTGVFGGLAGVVPLWALVAVGGLAVVFSLRRR